MLNFCKNVKSSQNYIGSEILGRFEIDFTSQALQKAQYNTLLMHSSSNLIYGIISTKIIHNSIGINGSEKLNDRVIDDQIAKILSDFQNETLPLDLKIQDII
ncbi:hypothetical protein [Leptospira borgpetersenii]|uniref:Uncharacterized protein n=2 Tax=Leptospira borgpetersenii TaxID=174 RepID=A0A0E3AZP3_LEPBO|nr:hypothetical protein [Leptospira borgpetersenii]EMO11438.1 hypothetical protein LEP1GSC137_2945 [Leptospira borgpetersenii str. Noumea 25]ALO24551.1 hypothetical protein LBBP_00184 [Leptospira borgpetersenii serovar Ballum]EKQ98841.1 hypothetical protein LEP1GSC121_0450 [Leptospira borgpetersenii serovar Castellonis str. 200801910]KGE22039.1 hypothetical protein IQ66_18900 [Leptospira borgpetersenii serovar Ballum]MBE8161297.1 hypothetical protein [Leptospira borgpetersenii serovar Ballum]